VILTPYGHFVIYREYFTRRNVSVASVLNKIREQMGRGMGLRFSATASNDCHTWLMDERLILFIIVMI
jgi:hypothetical protein